MFPKAFVYHAKRIFNLSEISVSKLFVSFKYFPTFIYIDAV